MGWISKAVEALRSAFTFPAGTPYQEPAKTLLPADEVMQAARDGNTAVVMHHFGENFTGTRGCIRSNGDMLLAAAENQRYETVEAILAAHAEGAGVPSPTDIDLANLAAVEAIAKTDPTLQALLTKYDEIADAKFRAAMAGYDFYGPLM